MGLIYAELKLINAEDMLLARRHIIGEEEIKQMTVNALVDTGAYMLCINENIQEQLQLPFLEKRKAHLADGGITECDVVGPIEVKFKNRRTMVNAMVSLVIMRFYWVLFLLKTWMF
jgi:clan AA aspartic protease